jgi:hypothetical protein
MKTSHIITIAATASSATVIGARYAPEITNVVVTISLMTVILSFFIVIIPKVIGELRD